MEAGKIVKVSGPLIVAEGMAKSKMYDVVRVSDKNLIGEIIELRGDLASIQVYEDTSGIGPGEQVVSTGMPLSVELGPGIIEGIYDGIQRPLDKIREVSGDRIDRGIQVNAIDREKVWDFEPVVKKGDKVSQGMIIGTVQETEVVLHKIMMPIGLSGEIVEIKQGKFKVEDTIAVVKDEIGVVK